MGSGLITLPNADNRYLKGDGAIVDGTKTKSPSLTVLSAAFSKIRKWPELGAASAFLLAFVIFSILAAPRFFTAHNLAVIFTIVSELGIIAIGVAFLMIAGEIDLSVGAVYAVSGLLFVTLANHINSVSYTHLTLPTN